MSIAASCRARGPPYWRRGSGFPRIEFVDDRPVVKLQHHSPSSRGVARWQGVGGDLIDHVLAWVQVAENPLQVSDRVGVGKHLSLGIYESVADRHRSGALGIHA